MTEPHGQSDPSVGVDGRALAESARRYFDTDDWFRVLTYARKWNLDDWRAVARRGRLGHVPDRLEALSALYVIEAETVPTAVIRMTAPCSVPAPHDREDCDGY